MSKKLSQFKPQTRNANKGNQAGIRELDKSIRRDGYSAPIVAAADGEVFAGSKRLERAADVFGLDVEPIIVESDGTRPVIHIRTDILTADDPRAIRLGVADNAIASTDWNPDGEVLALLAAEDEAIADMVKADDKAAKALLEYANGQAGDADAEPQTDRAAELLEKWQVKTGDLWRIGEHRLLCGDSTKRDDVERVMGGEKADCIWTDPPYGVDYKGGAKEREEITNDGDVSAARNGLKLAFDFIRAGGVIYSAAPPARLFEFWEIIIKSGYHYSTLLIWKKNNFAGGWGDYRGAYENIFYGWKPGKTHLWVGGRDKSTVFEFDKPSTSDEHPTMKPIELVQAMIENSSNAGDLIYEPFAGSGTTLVACQNLSRRCRAIEISPAYCAVILERMATAFPELVIERVDHASR